MQVRNIDDQHHLARVIPNAFVIPKWLKDKVNCYLPEKETIDIGGGPYRTFDVDRSWHKEPTMGGIYANIGPVHPHQDGMGNTFGLVIINEGNHRLVVEDQKWDMPEGSVFHINSDETHSTISDERLGLIVVATIDYGWKHAFPRDLTYHEIGQTILQRLEQTLK